MTWLKKNFWRIIIISIGSAMILVACTQVTLGLIGGQTTGVITEYRRIMGERSGPIPNRYTYSLGYKFTLRDQTYTGTSTVIGSPLFIKPDGTTPIKIRYFVFLPYISAPQGDTNVDIGKFALIGFGSLLIYVMNPKQKRRKKRN
ncbi:MAG: hypothetical protein FD133_232 [Erysipelotrichaceae bacterium]|nr:MAG: hypothetical protein FD179_317 [Erysipelotrichaceae bacterium]TXT19598.1 MAG: hypothetical protein FD133_232 [Erysipelotrichaceae bacterium]